MGGVYDVKEKTSLKLRATPSSKEGKAFQRQIDRRKAEINTLVEELHVWGLFDRGEAARLTTEELASMYETGEATFGATGAGKLYHGKIIHRCRADLARCEEELITLTEEKKRLGMWLDATMRQLDIALTRGGGPGKALLLHKHRSWMAEMKTGFDELSW